MQTTFMHYFSITCMHIICPDHLQYIYHISTSCFVIFLYFAAAQNVMFYIEIIIDFVAVTKQFPVKDHKVFILLSQVTVSKLPLKAKIGTYILKYHISYKFVL